MSAHRHSGADAGERLFEETGTVKAGGQHFVDEDQQQVQQAENSGDPDDLGGDEPAEGKEPGQSREQADDRCNPRGGNKPAPQQRAPVALGLGIRWRFDFALGDDSDRSQDQKMEYDGKRAMNHMRDRNRRQKITRNAIEKNIDGENAGDRQDNRRQTVGRRIGQRHQAPDSPAGGKKGARQTMGRRKRKDRVAHGPGKLVDPFGRYAERFDG